MALTPEGLTAEDGRDYARLQQPMAEGDPGQLATAAPRAPAADAPMSVKLRDVVERHATALDANDLSVVNASVVDLQAYESMLAAPPVGLPLIIDVPYLSQDAEVLSCTMGNWQNEPSSYAYQWQLDGADVGVPVENATYTVLPEDVGRTATCVVTATNDAGSTVAPPSNPVVVADPTPAAREA